MLFLSSPIHSTCCQTVHLSQQIMQPSSWSKVLKEEMGCNTLQHRENESKGSCSILSSVSCTKQYIKTAACNTEGKHGHGLTRGNKQSHLSVQHIVPRTLLIKMCVKLRCHLDNMYRIQFHISFALYHQYHRICEINEFNSSCSNQKLKIFCKSGVDALCLIACNFC